MGRLVDWPRDLPITFVQPLNGPRAIGASAGQGFGGYNQTVASMGFLWEFQYSFAILQKSEARAFRAWIMSLHGGANATRFPFVGGIEFSFSELGMPNFSPVPWSNGSNWQSGQPWQPGLPVEAVAADAAEGDTEIEVTADFWGGSLDVGAYLGFSPFHLGAYMVTEDLGNQKYRIFPPLRKAVAAGDVATLEPVLAMRLAGVGAADVPTSAIGIQNASVRLVEVLDADVRDFFAG